MATPARRSFCMDFASGFDKNSMQFVRVAIVVGLALGLVAVGCSQSRSATAPNNTDLLPAVMRLEVEACGGGVQRRATGVALQPDLVATVAHAFDGAARFELVDADGQTREAAVVWLDPARDLAVLRLARPMPGWLPLGDEPDGAAVEVLTRAGESGVEVKPARLVQHVTATLDGEGRRDALELEVEVAIEAGDSGSPVVDAQGEVVGVVFATTRPEASPAPTTDADGPRGWAIAASELATALDQAGTEPLPLAC